MYISSEIEVVSRVFITISAWGKKLTVVHKPASRPIASINTKLVTNQLSSEHSISDHVATAADDSSKSGNHNQRLPTVPRHTATSLNTITIHRHLTQKQQINACFQLDLQEQS
jgi:hypothetical protein